MSNVIELGNFSVHSSPKDMEVERKTKNEPVMALFYDDEGDVGFRLSDMTKKDALWMLERAKMLLLTQE